MVDRYWFGKTSRISPEAPVPIVKIHEADNRPGGAGNVAVNIAALGAHAILLGLVGKDEAADLLVNYLDAASVQHDLFRLSDISTIIKLRIISRQQQLIRLDFEEKLLPTVNEFLLAAYQKYLAQVKLVILSDYQKGSLSAPQPLIQMARQVNIPVLVDPKSHDFSIYHGAHIITPNMQEFEGVVGPCANEQAIIEKGRALLEAHDIHTLLVTRGEKGMTLIRQQGEAVHLPAYAREVYDVTGAGDTVIATLGAAVASGLDIVPATALANLAASLSVTKLGATSISAPELQSVLTGKITFGAGILNEEQLLQIRKSMKEQGKKVVFTNGCFDIFHAGHAACLKLAKELGDYLVVAVNDDASISRLKGENRPINKVEHRMTVLASLGMVDGVISYSDDTPERLLKLIKPDVLVKGGDYTVDQVVGAEIVLAYGGEVRVVNHPYHTSSTAILDQLQTPVLANSTDIGAA